MAPTGSSHLNMGMAVLCAAGGVVGFIKARSVPSLLAGVSLGAAYGAAAYLINEGDPATGHLGALCTSTLLTGAMGLRFAKTRKVMPAGGLAVAGLAAAVYNANKYQEWSS